MGLLIKYFDWKIEAANLNINSVSEFILTANLPGYGRNHAVGVATRSGRSGAPPAGRSNLYQIPPWYILEIATAHVFDVSLAMTSFFVSGRFIRP